MTWHRPDRHHQPTEGQRAEVLRVFGGIPDLTLVDPGGWMTAHVTGVMHLTRPDLGHEGWSMRQTVVTTHVGIVVPDDFPADLVPTAPGDHIFWRPIESDTP